jgi:hypothetical protein
MPHLLRTNLILGLIIALLAAVIWWSQPSPLPPLSQLTPQKITKVHIDGQARAPVTLSFTGNQWLVGSQPGRQSRIKQLLQICQTPSLSRFSAPESLAPFGLEPPELVLQLNHERFIFGDLDPVNGWRYVLHNNVIHLIGNGFHHHLTAPLEAWLEDPDA